MANGVTSRLNLIPPDKMEELRTLLDTKALTIRQSPVWIQREARVNVNYPTVQRWYTGLLEYKFGNYNERKSSKPYLPKKVSRARSNQQGRENLAAASQKIKEAAKTVKKVVKSKKTKVVAAEDVKLGQQYQHEVAFQPNEGPQTAFLAAPETDVLYGGAAGGGKSLAMIVDPLRSCDHSKHRALILRRSLKELRQLIDMSRELYPKAYPGTKFKETEKIWNFPSGAKVEFGYLEKDADVYQYQGQDFCVEENTQLSTPMGPIKIKDIIPGVLVDTLEGPRVVSDTFPRYETECVQIEFEDGSSHVQPVTHSFLTSLGWQSYASLLGINSKEFEEKPLESSQHPYVYCFVERLVLDENQGEYTPTSTKSPVLYKLNKSFEENTSIYERQLLEKLLETQQTLVSSQSNLHRTALNLHDDAMQDEQIYLKATQDYRDNYFAYSRLYDELLQAYLKIFQGKFPKIDGVEVPYPSYHNLDVQGNILEDTHSWLKRCVYHHAYTGQVRLALYQRTFDSCKISYVGKKIVCDITVNQSNHYIIHDTKTIVKNSWIGFDEISQLPTEFPWHYLASRLRTSDPSLKVYLRCTTNPGGPGHGWVKRRYLDPASYGTPFVGNDGISRRFIPATLRDNPYLYNDGRYQKMLESLPEVQRRQLLEGDWEIAEGIAFPEFQKNLHVIQPFSIPRGWARTKACDYGFSAPSCVLWGAVDPQDGTVIIYKELYEKGLTAKDLGDRIRDMEMDEVLTVPGVIDHSVFNRTGYAGPTIGEILNKNPYNLKFRPADKNRRAGKIQVHEYFRKHHDSDRPRVQIFSTCTNLIRELSSLILDKNDPEDVDTHMEDHAYDAFRYLLMSRPRTTTSYEMMWSLKREKYTVSDPVFGY